MIGEVIRYQENRGFGFIRAITGGDLTTEQFFHVSAVEGRIILKEHDLVFFIVAPSKTREGCTEATNVRLLKRDGTEIVSAPEIGGEAVKS